VQNEIHSTVLRSLLTEWRKEGVEAQIDRHNRSTGLSGALVWRIEIGGNAFCLKRWPREYPTRGQLAAVHGLLQHVAKIGLKIVPVPVKTRDGHNLLSRNDYLWELTPWLPGEPYDPERPSATKRLAAVRVLAEFHRAAHSYETPTVAAAAGLLKRREILRELSGGGLAQLRRAVSNSAASEQRSIAEQMLVLMKQNLQSVLAELERVAETPLPLQWCLRDVKCDHLLFTDNQVTGLIDFGAAAIDSVAGDVARLVGSMAGGDRQRWQSAIEAYHASRPLSTDERRAVDCFDRGGAIAAAANWLRWLFVEQRPISRLEAVQTQLAWLRDRLQAHLIANQC
jgi:Ser/Thr protein kinase RdoA (MazF antagonist)